MAQLIQVPFAIAAGGLAMATFAVGTALLDGKVRNLGALVRQAEDANPSGGQLQQPSPAGANR